jgi:hypothetical protein
VPDFAFALLHFLLFFFAKLGSAHCVARSVDAVVAEPLVEPVLGVADGAVVDGVVADEPAELPAEDGEPVICAEAMVAPPTNRIAAAAVRPVFLKVISCSS